MRERKREREREVVVVVVVGERWGIMATEEVGRDSHNPTCLTRTDGTATSDLACDSEWRDWPTVSSVPAIAPLFCWCCCYCCRTAKLWERTFYEFVATLCHREMEMGWRTTWSGLWAVEPSFVCVVGSRQDWTGRDGYSPVLELKKPNGSSLSWSNFKFTFQPQDGLKETGFVVRVPMYKSCTS